MIPCLVGLIVATSVVDEVPSELVHVGRWGAGQDEGKFQWPGSGFQIRFEGKECSAVLIDSASGSAHSFKGKNSNSLAIRVDGGEWRKLELKPGQNRYVLADSLPDTEHSLEVYKRTESSVGWVKLVGLDVVGSEPKWMKSAGFKGSIEIFGDSNSCGYGLEESSRDDHYSPSTQNSVEAFAFSSAMDLGYEPSLICASGWGIMRGYGGQPETNIPRVFDRNLIDEESTSEAQNLKAMVVILGDNDFAKGDPGEKFDNAYRAFVNKLLARSGEAKIVLCVSSPMYDSDGRKARTRVSKLIDSIISETRDKRLFKFEFPRYQAEWGYGADWHVSREATQHLRSALREFLRQIGL